MYRLCVLRDHLSGLRDYHYRRREVKEEENNVENITLSLRRSVEANFTCLLLLNTQKRHLLRCFSFSHKITAMPYFVGALLYAPAKFSCRMARNADALIKTQGSRKDFVFVGGGNATKQVKVFA